ncbi:MAG: acyl-CoA synthetase [Deltaproteobacteria bacterium]|nr:acyl-CoA synthetase [Deltaproteobacteria bacterium]
MELGFWNHALEHPERTAAVDPDGSEYTAGELLAAANRIVHGLRTRGLEPGDAVAVMLPNGHEVLELFMAVAQAGFFLTPLNWHLTAPEVAYILEDSGAKVFVASERFAEVAARGADSAGLAADARFAVGAIPGFAPYAALGQDQPATMPEARAAGGPMTYTSGTTGKPKGVRRDTVRASPEAVSTQQALFLGLFGILPGSAGVHLVVAPLYHTAVLSFATNHLHLGHTVVLMDRWTPEEMLRVVERYRVTSSHMVPTHFIRLLKLPAEVKARYDLSSLSHVVHSAAPCPVETKQAMLDWWGPCVYEYYAASEGGGTLATPADWLSHPGTVGRPWPISQIRVLDDDGEPCAPGEPGTVWIRMGEHRFEYHKDQAKTGNAWRDGFFTVGDAGYLDEDGYLFLCDRKADMIISGGVNIYPAEIEAVLVLHPKIADVAVFGIPHPDWGEEVKAVVQPAAGVTPSEALGQEILDFAAQGLARYKLPRSVDFTEALPRDPSGKLYKRKLRDPYWQDRGRAI